MNAIGPIIAKYRKEQHLTQPELAELLKQENVIVTEKALSGWESGRTEPSVNALFALCKILQIKDIYKEVFGVNPYDPYKNLNELGRSRVSEYVDMLTTQERFTENSSETIARPISRIIRLFTERVSAGTGNFLEGDDYEEIEVDEFVPAATDFAVKITGDSMMPMYHDKQVIYIHKQDFLGDGEIGIFVLDGNAYCKKLQNNKKGTSLISLNKKYAPIPVTDANSLTILGRVL